MKVLITTVPFGQKDTQPLENLNNAGIEYLINPINRKLDEDEIASIIGEYDAVIAGTEPITDRVLESAPKLKLISRVGIGLDSVDLSSAKRRGIEVSYTPDAPSPAVAELTVGLMLALLRSTHRSNMEMHNGQWHRYFGKRLSECVVGIIGAGRIGSRVVGLLSGFGCNEVKVNDLNMTSEICSDVNWEWCDKVSIYREADIISLHVPLNAKTRGMISRKELLMMKSHAYLINTSRGGIVDEDDLSNVLSEGHLGGAAIDVFEKEPYAGPLTSIDRCLLTAHMGSMSEDCRARMEIEATEEVVRFCKGIPLTHQVPTEEYANQKLELHR